ncbi:MAG: CoA-transferase, partial [Nitrospinota bacterium]
MSLRPSSLPETLRRAGDQMAVCLAREIRDGERVFHGVNSPLPMVAIFLAQRLHAPRLVLLEVAGAVAPRPRFMPRSTNDPELCHGAAALFSNADTYDLFARGGVDLAFLGAAQLDKSGRVNVSSIGDPARPRVRLPGGGGGAVIMPQAGRT